MFFFSLTARVFRASSRVGKSVRVAEVCFFHELAYDNDPLFNIHSPCTWMPSYIARKSGHTRTPMSNETCRHMDAIS